MIGSGPPASLLKLFFNHLVLVPVLRLLLNRNCENFVPW
jgi:hypothetical protein